MIKSQKYKQSSNKKKTKNIHRNVSNDMELLATIIESNPKLKMKVLDNITPKINMITAQKKAKEKNKNTQQN